MQISFLRPISPYSEQNVSLVDIADTLYIIILIAKINDKISHNATMTISDWRTYLLKLLTVPNFLAENLVHCFSKFL